MVKLISHHRCTGQRRHTLPKMIISMHFSIAVRETLQAAVAGCTPAVTPTSRTTDVSQVDLVIALASQQRR